MRGFNRPRFLPKTIILKIEMMKKLKIVFASLFAVMLLNACSSDDSKENDTTKPTIDLAISGGFPTSCTTVTRGSSIPFKALFKDNEQLGSYSINIHHNFDHHSHDTEVDACAFGAVKTPVNPWVKTLTFDIPANLSEYTATQQIEIPTDIDTGDYHFMIQLTDANGWATMKGISFKIVE